MTRAQKLRTSQRSSPWVDLCRLLVALKQGVKIEEAVGRAGLILETETALDTAGIPICWFSNFSISINFLLGCHTSQLFDPLNFFSCAHKSAEVDFAIGLCFSVRFCRRTCQTLSSWQWRTVCFRQRF